MSSRKASRKRKQDETVTNAPTDVQYTLFLGWLDEGVEGTNGEVQHEGFTLTIRGKTFDISIGDAVLTRSSSADDQSETDKLDTADPGRGMIARVERIWETKNTGTGECPFMFQARWFLRKSDLQALQSDFAIPSWDLDFISRISEDDLILSNQADDNALTTIAGKVQVVYRRPESDSPLPSMPADMFACRYSVSFAGRGDSSSEGFVRIIPFVGRDDKWEDCVTPLGERAMLNRRQDEELAKQRMPIISSPSASTKKRIRYYSDDSDDSSSGQFQSGNAVISEGAIDHRNTRVGYEHQVSVPKFDSSIKPKIVSRNPKPVWKPGQASREAVQSYMTKASAVLIPYLQRKGLTHTDPFYPLTWEHMEALTKEMDKFPTLSTICTASALSEKRTDMLREVDADALMRHLHEHSYNADDALRGIEAAPEKFVTSMTMAQKDIVDSAFRRYAGSFRMVYKALAPAKTMQDVIDYIYRYKIPDQYRLFQETKREAAIRMIESIESRRKNNANINVNKEPSERSRGIDWQKTSINEVTENLDDRRAQAKRLLLDIEEELGNDKMREVALLVKTFHKRPAIESRARLLGVLNTSESLKQRMIEFLPKRF